MRIRQQYDLISPSMQVFGFLVLLSNCQSDDPLDFARLAIVQGA